MAPEKDQNHSITWELVKNENSQVPSIDVLNQTQWKSGQAICILTRSAGTSDAS